jgi:hypothetical protein
MFVVAGTGLLTLGLGLMTQISANTNRVVLSLFMVVVGLGIGCCMQNLTLAVQNSVDYRDLGTATAANTFFRSLGGAIGVAVLGAVFSAQLTAGIAKVAPPGASLSGSGFQVSRIQHLPEPLHTEVLNAFAHALDVAFIVAVGVALVAFLGAMLLREIRLGTRSGLESAAAAQRLEAANEMQPVEPI